MKSQYTKEPKKKSNLWKSVDYKEIVTGVIAWEKCLEIPEGIIDLMNQDVDNWIPTITDEMIEENDSYITVRNDNGPIRFNPELEFTTDEAKTFFKQVQKNALDKISVYCKLFPDVEEEINWMENWQYITYKPPKNMNYHSDNSTSRNPKTNQHYLNPYFRRITCLTYLNDDFRGGALDFRYFDHNPYKPPAGSVVIMPSSYIYSHATTPLLNGRKSAFLVSCASHFDIDNVGEENDYTEVKRRELR